MNKFGLTGKQYSWIKKILSAYLPEAEIYVFGSRARGDYKRYSDLDLAVQTKGPVSQKTWSEIQEQFSESSIPFKIDLIEVSKIDSNFKKAIQEELQLFD